MTLDEARKIKESLDELIVDEESFAWGPSFELAKQRQVEALKIIRREIKRLKDDQTI